MKEHLLGSGKRLTSRIAGVLENIFVLVRELRELCAGVSNVQAGNFDDIDVISEDAVEIRDISALISPIVIRDSLVFGDLPVSFVVDEG